VDNVLNCALKTGRVFKQETEIRNVHNRSICSEYFRFNRITLFMLY